LLKNEIFVIIYSPYLNTTLLNGKVNGAPRLVTHILRKYIPLCSAEERKVTLYFKVT